MRQHRSHARFTISRPVPYYSIVSSFPISSRNSVSLIFFCNCTICFLYSSFASSLALSLCSSTTTFTFPRSLSTIFLSRHVSSRANFRSNSACSLLSRVAIEFAWSMNAGAGLYSSFDVTEIGFVAVEVFVAVEGSASRCAGFEFPKSPNFVLRSCCDLSCATYDLG
jgi:hypothetical protein